MEFFKLILVMLAVPFVTLFLYFVVITEKIGQAYGLGWMVAAICITLIVPSVAFMKDLTSGILASVFIGALWAVITPRLL